MMIGDNYAEASDPAVITHRWACVSSTVRTTFWHCPDCDAYTTTPWGSFPDHLAGGCQTVAAPRSMAAGLSAEAANGAIATLFEPLTG